jgi:hypothetical protein
MRFVNDTPLEAAMVPTCEAHGDAVTALFLCAVTYRAEDGVLALAPAQRPLLLAPGLPYPNDAMFFKAGVSVCATGFVYPRDREGRQGVASLRAGAAEAAIAAFGVRVWEPALVSGALVPSRPLPFERVAMTWKNAFGGIVEEPAGVLQVDGEEAFLPAHESGYPLNFDGTGFYTDARRALNQPLPQLEHPGQLLAHWDDRPEPVSFAPCPLWSGLRAQFVMCGGRLDPTRIHRIPSRAAPRTTFERLDPGTQITLSGMRPSGAAISFAVPPSPVTVDLSVGGRAEQAGPALDAVDIDAEAREVRFVYRAAVTYDLVQFELRTATMTMVADFPEA